jgi:hypothetical protein
VHQYPMLESLQVNRAQMLDGQDAVLLLEHKLQAHAMFTGCDSMPCAAQCTNQDGPYLFIDSVVSRAPLLRQIRGIHSCPSCLQIIEY